MRQLVFGPMPEGASPATHIPAGPWCFCNREELFPGWDADGGFHFPPDPFADGTAMQEYAAWANAEAERLIGIFGQRLNRERKVNFSRAFWEMALGPWLVLSVHMLAERQKRILDLLGLYGREELEAPVLPAGCPCSFTDSMRFMLDGVQNVDFNHYLFSRILEAVSHPWKIITLAPKDFSRGGKTRPAPGWKTRLRAILRDLPFPRYKGFSLRQALRLSYTLISRKTPVTDRSIPLSAYGPKSLEHISSKSTPAWVFPAEELIWSFLPTDLRTLPLPRIPHSKGKARGMTPAVSQDESYRLKLAAWLEGGGSLFCVQHGANYGNLRSIGGSFFEYRQHAFFSWGWTRHEPFPCNASPLPHPLTANIFDRHREETASLLMVGSAMSSFLYRLKSRPQSGQLVQYRRDKAGFLSGLDAEILAQTSYRPYFEAQGALLDAPWVLGRFPQLKLCKGNLTQHMLSCRLLILDHYGTTLHQALAANVPTLCFWKHWDMEEKTAETLKVLHRAGMLFSSPAEAAVTVNAVWPDVRAWWQSPARQEARRLWLERYALSHGPGMAPLHSREMTRLWGKALRAL